MSPEKSVQDMLPASAGGVAALALPVAERNRASGRQMVVVLSSQSKVSIVLNSIGPAPTAVSPKPVRPAVVDGDEFMPTILAKVFSWGASMSTVTWAPTAGVDGDVDGHAAHAMLVAVDAGRLAGRSHGGGILGERLVVIDEERVRSGERGEGQAGGLLVAAMRETRRAVEDQADHGDHGDECEREDDDDLATSWRS